jgi:hypothetical protein
MAKLRWVKDRQHLALVALVQRRLPDLVCRDLGDFLELERAEGIDVAKDEFDEAWLGLPATEQRAAWRALGANRGAGHVAYADEYMAVADDWPNAGRPEMLLRFDNVQSRKRAGEWQRRAGYPSLNAFVIAALAFYEDHLAEEAGDE